jgi:hypothetical protein
MMLGANPKKAFDRGFIKNEGFYPKTTTKLLKTAENLIAPKFLFR